MRRAAVERDRFDAAMGGDRRIVPPGVSYMPRDFMPTNRFSTRSSRPMPFVARERVQLGVSRVAGGERLAVDRDRVAMLEIDRDVGRLVRRLFRARGCG